MDDGYALIKALFTQVRDGVEVRFKVSDQSRNLNPDQLRGKYGYYYDQIRKEDVFILSRARLNEIDRSDEGVETNSLAVKILERLSAYYFSRDWGSEVSSSTRGLTRTTSLSAHMIKRRFDGTPSMFVGKLLGIESYDSSDIDKIVKLKNIFPDLPIYIDMNYGKVDAYGRTHSAHALRIDKIVPDRHDPANYRFVLVNPWNNEIRKEHRSQDLQRKNCSFSIYKTNPQRYEFARMLLSSSDLLNITQQIKSLSPSFSPQDIEFCTLLFRNKVDLPIIFNGLSTRDQQSLVLYMSNLKSEQGRKTPQQLFDLFDDKINEIKITARQRVMDEANTYIAACVQELNALTVLFGDKHSRQAVDAHQRHLLSQLQRIIQNDPHLAVMERTLGFMAVHPTIDQASSVKTQEIYTKAEQQRINIERAHEVVDLCVYQIDVFPVSFEAARSIQEVEEQRRILLTELTGVVDNFPQIMAAIAILGYPGIWFGDIAQAVTIQTDKINHSARDAKDKIASRRNAELFLEEINFAMHLSVVNDKANELQMIAGVDNRYDYSAQLAKRLHLLLETAKNDFIFSGQSKDERLRAFRSKCYWAVREAVPILKGLFDWQELLSNIEHLLISIPVAHRTLLPMARFGLFSDRVSSVTEIQDEQDFMRARL